MGRKFTIFALFYFEFESKFHVQAPRGAYIRRGDLTEGFLRYNLKGLIFGGAYTWRGLFSEFYGILRTLSLNFSKNYCSFMKLYQKRQLMFHPISRHLEVGLKKLGRASFFNPLLGV